MLKVAKLVFVDKDGACLMMYRSDHPRFGRDPDLPGGMVEAGESTRQAVIREVAEEAGVVISDDSMQELYAGTDYSTHGTHKTLFVVTVDERPEITMSWEHSAYEWLPRADFLALAKNANDDYMHMVSDVMRAS